MRWRIRQQGNYLGSCLLLLVAARTGAGCQALRTLRVKKSSLSRPACASNGRRRPNGAARARSPPASRAPPARLLPLPRRAQAGRRASGAATGVFGSSGALIEPGEDELAVAERLRRGSEIGRAS